MSDSAKLSRKEVTVLVAAWTLLLVTMFMGFMGPLKEWLWNWIHVTIVVVMSVFSNPIFQSSVAIAVLWFAENVRRYLQRHVIDHWKCSYTYVEYDTPYVWAVSYLCDKHPDKCQHLMTNTRSYMYNHTKGINFRCYSDPNPFDSMDTIVHPNLQEFTITHLGKTIYVTFNTQKRGTHECNIVEIATYKWNRTELIDLYQEINRYAKESNQGVIGIHTADIDGRWVHTKSVSPHTLCSRSTPVLPENALNKVLDDVRRFLNSREKYEELTVPFHRGYLFHGVPGSGKTTLAKRIAAELHLNIYIVSSLPRSGDLNKLMMSVPARSMVLFEDIDIMLMNANRKVGKNNDDENKPDESSEHKEEIKPVSATKPSDSTADLIKSLTVKELGGVLNALDGIGSLNGSIVVMTTNKKESLDAALTRAGRVDYMLEFKRPTEEQIREEIRRFNHGAPVSPQLEGQWVSVLLAKEDLCMADVQELLIRKLLNTEM